MCVFSSGGAKKERKRRGGVFFFLSWLLLIGDATQKRGTEPAPNERRPMSVDRPRRPSPEVIKPDPRPRSQFHHVADIAPTIYEALGAGGVRLGERLGVSNPTSRSPEPVCRVQCNFGFFSEFHPPGQQLHFNLSFWTHAEVVPL